MDIKNRNLERLQTAQANYLDHQSEKLSAQTGEVQGFYLGYGTFELAQHCVELPNGDVVCGDQNSLQTNGSIKIGQKIMVHQSTGGTPMFYAMPR